MGKLTYIFGSMNSGKSAALLQKAYALKQAGIKVAIVTAERNVGYVTSRIGISQECIYIKDFLNRPLSDTSVVLIDEAQWLTKNEIDCLKYNSCLEVDIYCYGLRSDVDGEMFEGSKHLFIHADEVEQLKSMCHCGCSATYHNVVDKPNLIGKDRYESVCFKHWDKVL